MQRLIMAAIVAVWVLGAGLIGPAAASEFKVIQSQKTKDAVVTLKSESGRWVQGPNTFVLELTSPDGKPMEARAVTLSTSMAMPGMAPMIAGATLAPDKAPGRYTGKISFPDSGARQVTVSWEGAAGKGSARFSVPVR